MAKTVINANDTDFADILTAASVVGLQTGPLVPSGTIDGSNLVFTLPHDLSVNTTGGSNPFPASLTVAKDGLVMTLTDDYTFDGVDEITMVAGNAPNNHLLVMYRRDVTA